MIYMFTTQKPSCERLKICIQKFTPILLKKKKSFTSNKYYIKIGYINKDNPFYIQDSFVVLN